MDRLIRINATVFGRVQGVGFRYYTRQKAISLSLSGYVTNNYDGSVSVEAEGLYDGVMDFLKWLHEGPPTASVDQMNYREIEPVNQAGFEIKR